jgi:hypothetical protein
MDIKYEADGDESRLWNGTDSSELSSLDEPILINGTTGRADAEAVLDDAQVGLPSPDALQAPCMLTCASHQRPASRGVQHVKL